MGKGLTLNLSDLSLEAVRRSGMNLKKVPIPQEGTPMKLMVAVLVVLVTFAMPVLAEPVELKSLSLTYGVEMNPAGNATSLQMFDLRASNDKVSLKLTEELFSDGTDRQTLYVSKTGSMTSLAVRYDSISRLWIGLNHIQPISKELTLVIRPLVAAKDNTTSRIYVFADYSSGDKLGAMAVVLAMPGYDADVYLGPTWRDKNVSLYVAPSLSKEGCYYWEVSYSLPL